MLRASSGSTGLLYSITLAGVAFYSGYKPTIFLTGLGWVLLMLAMVSPFMFAVSLRAENLSWKVSLTIMGIMTAALIVVFFIPSWYWFNYLPSTDPLFTGR